MDVVLCLFFSGQTCSICLVDTPISPPVAFARPIYIAGSVNADGTMVGQTLPIRIQMADFALREAPIVCC